MILQSGLPSTRTSWNGCSWNFTEYPAGASLDALGGKYQTADGASVWLADVELEPYQALLKGAAMDIVTIGEVLIDLTPSAPLRWMLPPAPKS